MKTQELLEKRAGIVANMRGMLDVADAADRDLNGDEQAKYEAMESDIASIDKRVKNAKTQEALESTLDGLRDTPAMPVIDNASNSKFGKKYGDAFYNVMRVGTSGVDHTVMNALQVGTNSEGGFITPESFETALITALQDISEIRQYADVIQTTSTNNIPVETTLGTATWTAEEGAYTESDAAFGRVQLEAHKLATITKVSEELLQDAFFNIETYLATNFGKRFGLAEEAAFVNGNGSGKPTGIVGGSSAGVTAAGATAITTDELIDLFHSLLRPYRANAVWMINDSTAKLIRKLKDGDNQYIWQPGLVAGQPDLLLGRPVVVCASMPAATTGNKSVIFGDLSNYTIADRTGLTMQRLNELYAANGQVGFRAFKRTDGKVTLADGIKHLVQA